jgi:glycosyltransferase involved in cell wall biosynthesis
MPSKLDTGPAGLLLFVPEDWYLCSHRLPLIRGARAIGLRVTAVTRVKEHGAPILAAGAGLVSTRLRRGFRNPLREVVGLWELVRIYRRERPAIAHHVTPKSSLFGSLAAWLTGVPSVVNALAGLGYLYASHSRRAALARPLVTLAFRTLLSRRNAWLIVQNGEDLAFFADTIGIPRERIELIRGSGVNVKRFRPAPAEPGGRLRVVLVARLISEKGVHEMVAAARIVRARNVDVEFILAGDPDMESPSGVPAHTLRAWHDEGIVTWLGRVDDVPALLASCHVALLPTYYREGLPMSLLEAAACGLPIVATDVTGCREVTLPGVNGILVPPRDPVAIADAVLALAGDPELRVRLGRASRRLAEDQFAEEMVVGRTMDLYRRLLAEQVSR